MCSRKVSTICTTSLRPRGMRRADCRAASRPALSQAGLAWRRPRASAPMLGAPPKPAMRPSVAVELLPCEIDLQGRADEHVAGVVPGGLAEGAVGAQRAVRAGEEHIGPGADVVLHAELGAERVDRSPRSPASIAGISAGCGFSAQWLADLALQAQRLGIGRQQQLDRGGVEADAVVEPAARRIRA